MNILMKIIRQIRHPLQASRLRKITKELKCNIEEEVTDGMILLLLDAMSLIFFFDCKFRKNIENFNAKYIFRDKTNRVYAGAIFKNNRLEVTKEHLPESNIEIIFKDAKALRDFLFSGNPDIINALLENNINTKGNLNYVLKFGYMAKHLQLEFLG